MMIKTKRNTRSYLNILYFINENIQRADRVFMYRATIMVTIPAQRIVATVFKQKKDGITILYSFYS